MDPELARQAVEQLYGAARLEYTTRVHLVLGGEPWDSQVHVFKICNSPSGLNASVWAEQSHDGLDVHVVAHEKGVVTAADAVRSVHQKLG